jgi:hypothetical protein
MVGYFKIAIPNEFRWFFRQLGFDIEQFDRFFLLALTNDQQFRRAVRFYRCWPGIREWRDHFIHNPLSWVPPRHLEAIFPNGGGHFSAIFRMRDRFIDGLPLMWSSSLEERVRILSFYCLVCFLIII